MNWRDVKAKSDGTTLWQHTQEVLVALSNLIESLPLTDEEKRAWFNRLKYCVVMHDIGKIHPDFQKNLFGSSRYGVAIRHELVSAWMCEKVLKLSLEELFAIATHHKGVSCLREGAGRLDIGCLVDSLPILLNAHKELFDLISEPMREWVKVFDLPLEVSQDSRDGYVGLSQDLIAILRYKKQKSAFPDTLLLAKYRAFLLSADHLASAGRYSQIEGVVAPEPIAFQPKTRDGGYCEFRAFQIRLQRHIGDVILCAPTGSGKTEAALSWIYANHWNNARIFYLLPYTASINAMVWRMADIFGKGKVTPVHSRTLDFFYQRLGEEECLEVVERERVARDFKQLSREIFHPVKIATPHQVLKNALKGKGWELCLMEYEKGLFIFDEFHTYNPLLTGLIFAMARWLKKHFQARLFFMSATIPRFMLNRLVDVVFEGDESIIFRLDPREVSDQAVLGRKRHWLVCHEDGLITDARDLVKEQLRDGKSVLLIVNHIKSAQMLYGEFSEETEDVCMLHGGFHQRDRSEIERRITNKDESKRPRLLIATQAVEVSLDIDYDMAFMENAPVDALIQRFGRVNRRGSKGVVPVHVFRNIIGPTKYIYDAELLTRTWDVLQQYDDVELAEADLITACDEVYATGYTESQEMDFQKGLSNSKIAHFFDDMVAGDWQDDIEDELERNNLKIDVICNNLYDEYRELLEKKCYIEARQLLVSVYPWITNSKKSEDGVRVGYDLCYTEGFGVRKYEEEQFW